MIAYNVLLSNAVLLDYAKINIGEHTMISRDCKLITSWHDYDNFNVIRAAEINIGINVLITDSCIILPGITIGDNSVIGLGSVVTKSIPPNVFAAGNPARIIKQIIRDRKWWNE